MRVYGCGHVIAYNYVANFHDGIDVETYGNPDGNTPDPTAANGPYYPPRKDWHLRPVAIDYYNNYMTNFHDNAFEIDGSMHNIRVMRNMMLNSASHPMCNQPAIGGPIYWIRNIIYHAPGWLDPHQQWRAGHDLPQQHYPIGDQYPHHLQQPLDEQSDAGRECPARHLRGQHLHQLHLVGLQRLPRQSGRGGKL